MALRMYDLAGADPARRFSPYCWRTRMALKHKQLEVETIPWRFTDKEVIAPYYAAPPMLVPVLLDGEVAVTDSWNIAEYLEQAYPGKPGLFEGEADKRHARFLKHWTETQLTAPIMRMIALDIHNCAADKDREYFRSSREKRMGKALEEVVADREATRADFGKLLLPLRNAVKEQPFLCGAAAAYGDYVVFGHFQWARCVSAFDILAADDAPVIEWRTRMLGLFEGYAAGFPAG
ncbi:MAG TPA: glutathione S-transferase family protein [Burkholderiales bacterium]|nr:glutathione S-transferase family protein [Burkholderiales bacterium]